MAANILRRLRDIRHAEEEQNRTRLQSALAELQRVETAITETRERARRARALVASSAQTGEILDRIAGLEEARVADRTAEILKRKIAVAESNAQKKRQEFLDKRIERRQVETIYEAVQSRNTIETNRKNQLGLDDWHRSQHIRISREANTGCAESDISLTK